MTNFTNFLIEILNNFEWFWWTVANSFDSGEASDREANAVDG